MACALALRLMNTNVQDIPGLGWMAVVELGVDLCDDTGAVFGSQQPLNILFPTTSTPQQMKTAMSDGIIAYAASVGLTIAANDIILPDLQRG